MYRIACLFPLTAETDPGSVETFKARLRELGQVEGRDYGIEYRYAEGKPERMPALARDIVALNPSVILTAGSAAVATLQKATTTVPVVFATAADPVEQGFVKSLSRPGGNITGVSLRSEVGGKIQELLRDCLPAARRFVYLAHEGDRISKRLVADVIKNATRLRHEMDIGWVKNADDLQRAFTEIAARRADAVIVPQLSLFVVHSNTIVELARKVRVPLFANFRGPILSGCLLSYYSDTHENFRQAAVLVDKILRGAKPADLPVEQPDRFLLAVNLRTAKALGIIVPQSILLRADEVIQ